MESPDAKEGRDDLKGLYDLVMPIGMPITVIRELVEKFDLDVVRRRCKMDMTGEIMDREVVVLRGDLETVTAAKKYMVEALERKASEWKSKEREEKYRKYYEEQAKERMREAKEKPEAFQSWDTTPL